MCILKTLLVTIKKCTVCAPYLIDGVNPIVSASSESKIIIIGQAPGRIVHHTGILWNDKSGDNLRKWMGVSKEQFYDTNIFALMPMGFCFPGSGKSGDLPPRKECAPLYHQPLLNFMPKVKLILLVGQYAQNYYLQSEVKATLTETFKNFESYLPKYLPLPHPSPRNNIWQAKNPWYEELVLPYLKMAVDGVITK